MHIALWTSGIAFLVFLILALFLLRAADKPGDDFGAVYPGLLCAAICVICGIVWIVLVLIHLW